MKKIYHFLFTLFLSGFALNVSAHNLYVFAQYDGEEISGRAYYSDQAPAVETYVEADQLGLKGNEQDPVVTDKTDAEGHFILPVKTKGPFKVVVEGAEGHRAERIADNVAKKTMGRSEFELLREDL